MRPLNQVLVEVERFSRVVGSRARKASWNLLKTELGKRARTEFRKRNGPLLATWRNGGGIGKARHDGITDTVCTYSIMICRPQLNRFLRSRMDGIENCTI